MTLDLSGIPDSFECLCISVKRRSALSLLIRRILDTERLPLGEASFLAGKLGFALCAVFGRVGRAKLRPIFDRGFHHGGWSGYLHTQLRAWLLWWLRFLRCYTVRSMPTSLVDGPMVVSYSDGEGDTAGVGICVFSEKTALPVAAFAEVPDEIRRLWSRRAGVGEYHDIVLVEAIGPLLVLYTSPTFFTGSRVGALHRQCRRVTRIAVRQ